MTQGKGILPGQHTGGLIEPNFTASAPWQWRELEQVWSCPKFYQGQSNKTETCNLLCISLISTMSQGNWEIVKGGVQNNGGNKRNLIISITVETGLMGLPSRMCANTSQKFTARCFLIGLFVEAVTRERQMDTNKANQYLTIFKNLYPKPVPNISSITKITPFQSQCDGSRLLPKLE